MDINGENGQTGGTPRIPVQGPEQTPDRQPEQIPEQKPQVRTRNRFWNGFLIGLLSMLLIMVAVAGILIWAFMNGKLSLFGSRRTMTASPSSASEAPKELNYNAITAKMKLLQNIISTNYLFDEDAQKVEDGIYSGMLNGLGDPYTVYYSAKEYADLNEETNGSYSGIGALMQQDAETGIVTLIKIFENSPAEKAGLKDGDILYKVEDIEVTGENLDIIVNSYVKGKEGTDVHITVLRGNEHKEVPVVVTRAVINVPTVSSKMLDNQVGYIEVVQFDAVTSDQFKKAVDDLTEKGMKKLVIDLRDNPGGLVNVAVDMLDYMLPDGLLVYTADKNGIGDKYYSKDGHEVDLPTAILVNGNSASASEIFTGAYKDFKRATIVGTKTYGKGIVQNVIPLGDGTAVKITTQHYYTPSGFDLHKKGIEPDLKVEKNEGAIAGTDSDNQLKAAIEALQ